MGAEGPQLTVGTNDKGIIGANVRFQVFKLSSGTIVAEPK
jgi:hypothetical protein